MQFTYAKLKKPSYWQDGKTQNQVKIKLNVLVQQYNAPTIMKIQNI